MKGFIIAAWIAILVLGAAVISLWIKVERLDREKAAGSAVASFSVQSAVQDMVREQKRLSDLASVRFFPERAFDLDPVRDSVLADVYSRPLRSLAWCLPFATWDHQQRSSNSTWKYPRFRLLRTTPDKVALWADVYLEPRPSYEHGNVGDDYLVVRPNDPKYDGRYGQQNLTPVRFTPEQRSRYEELIEEMKFWEMPGSADPRSGDRLLLEGVDGDRYHVVVREGDSSKELVELFGIVGEVAERALKSQRPAQQGVR